MRLCVVPQNTSMTTFPCQHCAKISGSRITASMTTWRATSRRPDIKNKHTWCVFLNLSCTQFTHWHILIVVFYFENINFKNYLFKSVQIFLCFFEWLPVFHSVLRHFIFSDNPASCLKCDLKKMDMDWNELIVINAISLTVLQKKLTFFFF